MTKFKPGDLVRIIGARHPLVKFGFILREQITHKGMTTWFLLDNRGLEVIFNDNMLELIEDD